MQVEKSLTWFILILTSFLINCNSSSKIEQPNSGDSVISQAESERIQFEKNSRKKSLIKSLVGHHKLNSISGVLGANYMVEYYLENGIWTVSASSITEGIRDGGDIQISIEDSLKLNSMAIIVSEDLTLNLSCNGQEFFTSPFQEEGMSYFLEKSPSDYLQNVPQNLMPNSTFIEDYLYFYVKDNVGESEISCVDITQGASDVIIIKYNTKAQEFEMILFSSDCCNNSS